MLRIYIIDEMQTKAIRDFTVGFIIRATFNPEGIIVNRSNTIKRPSCLLVSKGILNVPDLFKIHSKSSCCLSKKNGFVRPAPYIAVSGALCQGDCQLTGKY